MSDVKKDITKAEQDVWDKALDDPNITGPGAALATIIAAGLYGRGIAKRAMKKGYAGSKADQRAAKNFMTAVGAGMGTIPAMPAASLAMSYSESRKKARKRK